MADSDFVHLHVHSDYSLLDGACRVKDIVHTAAEQHMGAVALTDHGNMFGAIQFYQAAQEEGVKPILGYEAYVAPGSRKDRDARGMKEAAGTHLTLLVADERGYRNLVKLASAAYVEGFYYKPRIDKEILAKHADGIIGLSGCLKSEVCRHILAGAPDKAARAARAYADIFGKDRFYLELQDNGSADQQRCAAGTVALAQQLGLPLVATNDIHYLRRGDVRAHEALLCINTGKTLADADRLTFSSDQYYFKSAAEMAERFGEYPGALSNTREIAERCNLKLNFDERHFPRYHVERGKTDVQFLRELCEKGLRERFKPARRGGKPPRAARERLDRELSVIEKMGFSSYFLIVWDIARFARERRIPCGLRGSGVSSLVCYVLYITDVDPLKYDLMFERIMDVQRKEPPDLDLDICEIGRREVIDYVRDKYGRANTAQIITFGTMAARAVVRDVGRVLGIPLPEVDQIAKLIPTTLNIKLEEAFKQEPELRARADRDPRIRELFDISLRLEGLHRHASTHAAGMVIAERPLAEYIPLYRANDVTMSQYDMKDLEKVGMLKLDLLGLRNLTILDKAFDLVEQKAGRRLDTASIPLNDRATYRLLARGDTDGVFQLGSEGIRGLLRRVKPKNLDDIIAVAALYRPGPLRGGDVDQFVNRRNGTEPVEYDHPKLEPILRATHGVIVFQEQIMRIANTLGNVPMSDAYTMIKAISKKQRPVIEASREAFLTGAEKNGLDRSKGAEIFKRISHFAEYGFNKAHTTAYAFIAYYTAYLKANYPVEFMAAEMTCEMNFTDKLLAHREDCKRFNVELLPPSVNESMPHFTVAGDRAIRFGLGAIRNVGVKAMETVVRDRGTHGKFTSIFDFCQSVDLRAVSRSVMEALIKAGAMDDLSGHRAQLMAGLETAIKTASRKQEDRRRGQGSLFDSLAKTPGAGTEQALPSVPEWPEKQLLEYEKEALGFYMSGHPLAEYEATLRQHATARVSDIPRLRQDSRLVVGGLITQVQRTTSKAGDAMAHVELEDLDGSTVRAVAFPKVYEKVQAQLTPDRIVFLRGRADLRMDRTCVLIDDVIPVERAQQIPAGRVTITLERAGLNETTLVRLRDLVRKYPGECELLLRIAFPKDRHVLIRAGKGLSVASSKRFSRAVERLVGKGHVLLSPGNGGNGGNRGL